MDGGVSALPTGMEVRPFRLMATDFGALHGFEDDDHLDGYRAFVRSARALATGVRPLRPGTPPSDALLRLCGEAAGAPEPATREDARRFFQANFVPYRIEPATSDGVADTGFLTGYYEPVVEGSLQRMPGFTAPVLARPDGFERLGPADAARPCPPRAAIEADAAAGLYPAIVWLRDWVEVFLIQVQGSARVTLADGDMLRLVYDGRNGQPYTPIGRILVQTGEIAASAMTLDRLKGWIRSHGQQEGEPGRTLMQRNRSFVFFRAEPAPPTEGPIGGAGVPLTLFRSIAVDRTIWPYGLPFWIDADLPWRSAEPSAFRRLMVAQDTGSAILGPARADLFFGSGDEAGRRAGDIRHPGRFTVLLPRDEAVGRREER